MSTPFHVYAEDGFEGAFAERDDAVAAAKRGYAKRRVHYSVVQTGPSGYTGDGAGSEVFSTKAAKMIAAELEAICTEDALRREMASETGSLRQHESLVRTRLGGDYDASSWDDAVEILGARYGNE